MTCAVNTTAMTGLEKILTETGSGLCYFVDAISEPLPEFLILVGFAGLIVGFFVAIGQVIARKVKQ